MKISDVFVALAAMPLLVASIAGCRVVEMQAMHFDHLDLATARALSGMHLTQVMYAEDIDVGQGKVVPVRALSGFAASASQSGQSDAKVTTEEAAPVIKKDAEKQVAEAPKKDAAKVDAKVEDKSAEEAAADAAKE